MPEPSPWLEQLGKWVSVLRSGWRKYVSPPHSEGAAPSLARMRPGQQGVIAYLREDDPVRMRKLLALGLLPGSRIELLRRFPSFILRMGFSRFALDREIADAIFVRLAADETALAAQPLTWAGQRSLPEAASGKRA